MSRTLDETHDPEAVSWVESANTPDTDFPLQNLPFGVFRDSRGASAPRIGIAIGDLVLDLHACHRAGLLEGATMAAAEACSAPSLNGLMSLGSVHWSALRRRVSALLRAGSPGEATLRSTVLSHLVRMADVEMLLPAAVGDYTDFYASIHHATNVGRMLRPDAPLLPNYKWVPIGYHGRASSLVVSGGSIDRPNGQTKVESTDVPAFGPSRRLDYELEVGIFIGQGNAIGRPIPIVEAEEHIFGLCLVNDWSARDIQLWEYQPLGPFLAKSFATSVSPWVVTLEALAPYRAPRLPRPGSDPQPLPYLDEPDDRRAGAVDIVLDVYLNTTAMRRDNIGAARISRGRFRHMYWTPAQLVTHHASNGCNLRPGDLLASGTVSDAEPDSGGCLLELSWRGQRPIALPNGESRAFLEDGDEVIFRGFCEAAGRPRIGFGECRGRIAPAL